MIGAICAARRRRAGRRGRVAARSARRTRARSRPATSAALVDRLRAAGCAAVTCADTTGMATPRRIDDVLDGHRHRRRAAPPRHPRHRAGERLRRDAARRRPLRHVGRRARRLAVRRTGAAGNLATEELVAVLDDLGVRTGIDVEGLVAAAAVAVGAGRPARAEPRRGRRTPQPARRRRPLRTARALVRGVQPLLQPQLDRPRRHLRAVWGLHRRAARPATRWSSGCRGTSGSWWSPSPSTSAGACSRASPGWPTRSDARPCPSCAEPAAERVGRTTGPPGTTG